MRQDPDNLRRIVIVGGGAGGAELASVLGRRSRADRTEVSLVDSAPAHLWKPRLHEVAAGLVGPTEDAISYLALARTNGFRFRLGALTELNPEARTIEISEVLGSDGRQVIAPREVEYDELVLAFGGQVNDFGVPGVVAYCHVLDSGEDAAAFQRQLLEAAVRGADSGGGPLRIGIVGAGATGVELAAELHHAIHELQHYGVLVSVDITVVEMGPRVLPASAPEVSALAHRSLQHAGVTVRLNAGVAAVTAEGFQLADGDMIPCELKVWASGVVGRPLAEQLPGLTIAKGRRIACDGFLRCKGVDNIYALGDCAEVIDAKTGRPLPPTAQVAHQQASFLADRLSGRKLGQAERGFRYRPRGSLVSLGEGSAAGEFPKPIKGEMLTYSGAIPKLLYASLQLSHRAKLTGALRAAAWFLAERLRQTSLPAVKLH
jgi:NADH dehydrogenase